jgi:YD repeat-containing protein
MKSSGRRATSRRVLVLVALAGMLGPGPIARADDAESSVVRPGTTDVIEATIRVGHLAEVVIDGDGDTDLYVYDPAGQLVGKEDDDSGQLLAGGIRLGQVVVLEALAIARSPLPGSGPTPSTPDLP